MRFRSLICVVEWLSNSLNDACRWTTQQQNGTTVHQIQLSSPKPFTEAADQALGYTAYHASPANGNSTYQSGVAGDLRGQFQNQGSLKNSQDTQFRDIGDNFPTFGLATDLGNIMSTGNNPVIFVVGLAPDDGDGAIQYASADGSLAPRFLYYNAQMDTITAVRLLSFANYIINCSYKRIA